MDIKTTPFGYINNQMIERFCLSNDHGMEVCIINYGAIIQAVYLPNRPNIKTNVVLGFSSLEEYQKNTGYLGAMVGRYANRVHHGKLVLEGKYYQLNLNMGENHLHGGSEGFDRKVWSASTSKNNHQASVELKYFSPDGEEHYPGNLQVKVRYTLTHDNRIKIDCSAETDCTTVVNLTQHSYFNLNGKGDCLEHVLTMNASRFLSTDINAIPLPGTACVKNTPMDFRKEKRIAQDIHANDIQLKQANGYDHCWLINQKDVSTQQLTLAACVSSKGSGILKVYTDQPGIQLYTGNYLNECTQGYFKNHSGFALETQQLPNSPNRPDFPSTIVSPRKPYRHRTEWHFSW